MPHSAVSQSNNHKPDTGLYHIVDAARLFFVQIPSGYFCNNLALRIFLCYNIRIKILMIKLIDIITFYKSFDDMFP